jgi:hypothetical protein
LTGKSLTKKRKTVYGKIFHKPFSKTRNAPHPSFHASHFMPLLPQSALFLSRLLCAVLPEPPLATASHPEPASPRTTPHPEPTSPRKTFFLLFIKFQNLQRPDFYFILVLFDSFLFLNLGMGFVGFVSMFIVLG